MDSDIKREIIMDNYMNPSNKLSVLDESYIKVNSNNESCIDNINLFLLIEDNTIKDLKFDGEACAITTASTSIMSNLLINKSLDEVLEIVNNYENMINEKDYDKDILIDANCFDEIYKQANRKNCALLPYMGIKKAIAEYKSKDEK